MRQHVDAERVNKPANKLTSSIIIEDRYAATFSAIIADCQDACETLTGLTGYRVRFGNRTSFDHERQEVIIGIGQLVKLGITDPQKVKFVILHELGHFMELAQDPEGYQKVIAEGTRSDGLGRTYFGFYNALMDIYVNTNTRNIAPVYSAAILDTAVVATNRVFSSEVENIYTKNLFKQRDFTDRPLCIQYGHYLLNLGMGTADDIKLSPEVRQKIKSGIKLYGDHYSYTELIDTYLVPAVGIRQAQGWQATVSQRKSIIDAALRPVFEELLAKDLAANKHPENFAQDPLGEFEISPDDLQKAADQIIKAETDRTKSNEQKAAEERAKQAEELGNEQGLSAAQAKKFAESLNRVQPVVKELVDIFKSVVFTTVSWKKKIQGFYRTGSIASINQAIKTFGKVATDPASAKIMQRTTYEEHRVEKPKKIKLWLVPDLSGSMASDQELLQDITVAFSAALTTLSLGKQLGQHQLGGSLRVLGFHAALVEVIPSNDNASMQDVARGFSKLLANGDSTRDHLALEQIVAEVKQSQQNEMATETDTLHILIEITDGETEAPTRSLNAVKKLRQLGVKTIAFKIGMDEIRSDKLIDNSRDPFHNGRGPQTKAKSQKRTIPGADTFSKVWNSQGRKDGFYIRASRGLIPAMNKALKDSLKIG